MNSSTPLAAADLPPSAEPSVSLERLASLEAHDPLEQIPDHPDYHPAMMSPASTLEDDDEEEDANKPAHNTFHLCHGGCSTRFQQAGGGGALVCLVLAHAWRGIGLVAGPHNYSVWAALLALCLSLMVLGVPLLVLELGLGETYRTGCLGIWQLPQFRPLLGRRHQGPSTTTSRTTNDSTSRCTGLGVMGLVMGMVLTSYSVAILAWTVHAFANTFTPAHATTVATFYSPEVNSKWVVQEAVDHFVHTIVGQWTLQNSLGASAFVVPTRIIPANALFALLLWTCVASMACIRVTWMRRVTFSLTSLGLILLVVLCGHCLSLSSYSSGSSHNYNDNNNKNNTEDDTTSLEKENDYFNTQDDFLVEDDFAAAIHHGDVLSQSMIQALYITGVLVGILPALASSNHKCSTHKSTDNNTNNPPSKAVIATLVVGLYIVVVFLSGFVLSVTLKAADIAYIPPYPQLDALSTTLMVVLVQWPTALLVLANGSSSGLAWVRLLYIVLILLGIQLPIAMISAIGTVLRDDRDSSLARWKIVGATCCLGFLATLLFTTDAGLVFLDAIDYYLSLAFLLVAILEAFVVGWIYNLEDQITAFGLRPFIFYVLWNFAPVLIAASVWFGFDRQAADNYERLWLGLFGGVVIFLLFFAMTFLSVRSSYEQYLARLQEATQHGRSVNTERIMDPRYFYMEFCFRNVETLKQSLEPAMGPLPQISYIFIKRVIPHLLLLLWIKQIMAAPYGDVPAGFGHYGGYPFSPYQLVGICVFSVLVGLFLLGLVVPQVYASLVPPPTSIFINRRDTLEDMEDTGDSSDDSPIEELPDMEEPVVLDDGNEDANDNRDGLWRTDDYWAHSTNGEEGGLCHTAGAGAENKNAAYTV